MFVRLVCFRVVPIQLLRYFYGFSLSFFSPPFSPSFLPPQRNNFHLFHRTCTRTCKLTRDGTTLPSHPFYKEKRMILGIFFISTCTAQTLCHSKCRKLGSGYAGCTFNGIVHDEDLCCPSGWRRDEGDGSRCDTPFSNTLAEACYTYGNSLPYDGSPYGKTHVGSQACPSLCKAVPHMPEWAHHCGW